MHSIVLHPTVASQRKEFTLSYPTSLAGNNLNHRSLKLAVACKIWPSHGMQVWRKSCCRPPILVSCAWISYVRETSRRKWLYTKGPRLRYDRGCHASVPADISYSHDKRSNRKIRAATFTPHQFSSLPWLNIRRCGRGHLLLLFKQCIEWKYIRRLGSEDTERCVHRWRRRMQTSLMRDHRCGTKNESVPQRMTLFQALKSPAFCKSAYHLTSDIVWRS